jgi:hypothetical protein
MPLVHDVDIAVFITGRVIIGFGLASFLMTSLVVVQEITHPRSRSTVAQSWVSDLVWHRADPTNRSELVLHPRSGHLLMGHLRHQL